MNESREKCSLTELPWSSLVPPERPVTQTGPPISAKGAKPPPPPPVVAQPLLPKGLKYHGSPHHPTPTPSQHLALFPKVTQDFLKLQAVPIPRTPKLCPLCPLQNSLEPPLLILCVTFLF